MNVTQSAFLLLILSTLFISLAFICGSPILATSEQNISPEEIQNAEQQFKEAFVAIREAEAVGAGKNQIAALVERLDSSLSLIKQFKHSHILTASNTAQTNNNTINHKMTREQKNAGYRFQDFLP